MFYYFKDKHKLLEVKLEFKRHNYMFKSYEMELYSVYITYKEMSSILLTNSALVVRIQMRGGGVLRGLSQ
jgi:hypothetical protein